MSKEANISHQSNVTSLDDARQARAQAESHIDAATTPESTAHAHAEVLVDSKANDRHGNRRFDAEKVARIKAAIAAGEYTIDPARIADRFIEHDRNQ